MSYSQYYEWREAARWAGYRYDTEFVFLDGEVQSEVIAHYRCFHKAEAVLAQEQQRAQERQSRAARRKGKGGK